MFLRTTFVLVFLSNYVLKLIRNTSKEKKVSCVFGLDWLCWFGLVMLVWFGYVGLVWLCLFGLVWLCWSG